MMFSQDKWRALHLAWTIPLHWLGTGRPGNSSAGKVPGVLVANWPNMSQQSGLAVMKANSILSCINRSGASRSRKWFISSAQHLSDHLYITASSFDPIVQERHRPTGGTSVKGPQDCEVWNTCPSSRGWGGWVRSAWRGGCFEGTWWPLYSQSHY